MVGKSLVFAALIAIAGIGTYEAYLLTRPKTVQNQLEKNGKSILSTSPLQDNDTSSEDYKNWKQIIDINKDSNSGLKEFAGLDDSSDTDDKAKINKLKTKCQSELKIDSNNKEFQDHISKAQKYCTKQTELPKK